MSVIMVDKARHSSDKKKKNGGCAWAVQHGLVITRQPSTTDVHPPPQISFTALCTTLFVTSRLAVTLALPSGVTGLMKGPKEVVACIAVRECMFVCAQNARDRCECRCPR